MQEQPGATTASAVAAADDAFGADLYRLLSEQAPDYRAFVVRGNHDGCHGTALWMANAEWAGI